ncbi:MAG: hypothetical protein IT372_32120 [Polyangiaceae bacterium]|nr:hypothetical protein [Polyangiaceae bacterium]
MPRAPRFSSTSTKLLAAALILAPGCAASPEPSEDTAEAEQAQVVCPAGETVEGIDVSFWQGDIDWQAVKGTGVAFAIARASYGVSKDTYFDANWAGIKSVGLVRGAYQYFLADQDPIAQADVILDAMGPLGPGDLPPVIDVESTEGQSAAVIAGKVGQWLAHVEAAIGRKPIIYTGKYFWQDHVASDAFNGYPLWIPNYSLSCPDLPNGYWTDWVMFQYSSTGSYDGISGNVDQDQFNGSLQDLLAFASSTPSYAAEFVSQSFPYASQGPLTMHAGDVVDAYIELRNTGSQPWDSNTRLAATQPRDRESAFAGPEWPAKNRFAQVEGTVMPGETYRFSFKLHAPAEAGTYDEFFGVVQEGVTWFSDAGQGGPPDDQLEGIFEVLPAIPGGGGGEGGGSGGSGGEAGSDDDAGDDGSCALQAGRSDGNGREWMMLMLGALAARRRRAPRRH